MTADQLYYETVAELKVMNIMELFATAEGDYLLTGLSKLTDEEIIHACAKIEVNNFCH